MHDTISGPDSRLTEGNLLGGGGGATVITKSLTVQLCKHTFIAKFNHGLKLPERHDTIKVISSEICHLVRIMNEWITLIKFLGFLVQTHPRRLKPNWQFCFTEALGHVFFSFVCYRIRIDLKWTSSTT